MDEIQTWLNETKENLKSTPTSRGLLGEMKTSFQKVKYIEDEHVDKEEKLTKLKVESSHLSSMSDDETIKESFNKLEQDLKTSHAQCKTLMNNIEQEINEYNTYHQRMQETEKWLLQIQFQLMAHNSLYITTREMTQQQLEQHEKLLNEIKSYQASLDSVRAVGEAQGKKYKDSNPELATTIDKQHLNIQESYNTLLQTATQIKNRLLDSLEKFKEYEETLQSIIENIDNWEPEIVSELDKPIYSLEEANNELDNIRVSEGIFHLGTCNNFLYFRASTIDCKMKSPDLLLLYKPAKLQQHLFQDQPVLWMNQHQQTTKRSWRQN